MEPISTIEKLLEPCRVSVQIPLQWGAMDAFQHLNNTVYFRYFEDVRMAYFTKVGMIEAMTLERAGVGPILASTQCRFKLPLRYPDTVFVGARVVQMGADRFEMAYTVISQHHQQVAAMGSGWIVGFDYQQNQKALLPDSWRTQIEALDGPIPRWERSQRASEQDDPGMRSKS